MHGEAGFKGTFTGSGTERKSIPPAGFTPKDKSKLALFKNQFSESSLYKKVGIENIIANETLTKTIIHFHVG